MKETVTKVSSYKFSNEELLKIGKELSLKNHDLKSLEDEKKSVTSEYKHKMDACSAEINILSSHISNGFYMKHYQCEVKRDFKTGYKYFIDVETGEEIAKEKLTAQDHQLRINDNE